MIKNNILKVTYIFFPYLNYLVSLLCNVIIFNEKTTLKVISLQNLFLC